MTGPDSTDKAAAPVTTTYGLTKALGERLLAASDLDGGTRFLSVRLGNLAWSTGSVLTEWKRMQASSGVITTTGPEMRRFIVRVDAAADFVHAALRNAEALGGKVLAMPAGVAQIGDLLAVFVGERGGSWVNGARRPGDEDDQWLIGESEAARTEPFELDGRACLALSLQARAGGGLASGVSTATARRLTPDELRQLVHEPVAQAVP